MIFILQVYDFSKNMTREEVLQFADDNASFTSQSKTNRKLLAEIGRIVQKTYNYLKKIMLTLNRYKTAVIVFSHKDQQHIEQIIYMGNIIKPEVIWAQWLKTNGNSTQSLTNVDRNNNCY